MRQARFKLSDDLGGLRVGDEVRVGGYKIGSVQSVQLVNAEDAKALPELVVEFSSRAPRAPRRRAARRADDAHRVERPELRVDRHRHADRRQRRPRRHARPQSRPAGELGKAAPQIETLVGDAKTVVQGVRTDTMPKVASTVEKAGRRHGPAGEAMAEVRDMIGPSKTDFHGTVANLNATTGDLRRSCPNCSTRPAGC